MQTEGRFLQQPTGKLWTFARRRICSIALFAAFTAYAQAPSPVLTSNVREVVLDVIVRHQDMSLDTKLSAADFTITEDGVPQVIKAFRFVGGREAHAMAHGSVASPQSAPVGGSANPLPEPNFVSIVLGEMGPASRRNAIDAAKAFLDLQFPGPTYAAVFRLGARLTVTRDFTNDRVSLATAIRRAASNSSIDLATDATGFLEGMSVSSAADARQGPDLATSGASEAPFSEAQHSLASMISDQRYMVSNIAGMQVINALSRLVEFESRLPGRKTVLFLSDRLIKPPGRPEAFRAVISAANRGNISFYCFDARGLTTATSNGLSSGLLNAAAGLDASQGVRSSSPSAATARADEFDTIALSLSSHDQLNMDELAKGTGGFAIFSTNDLKKNMARVMEDVRTHYEISYVPRATLYDGGFRQIKVSLRDSKLMVQSREGYFALPDLNGVSLRPYEMEGLRALQSRTRHDFDFGAAALRFQPLATGFRYEMAFDLDTSNLTTRVNPATRNARIHGTFLGLIKDPSGQLVAKVSQDIDREVPDSKLDQFRNGKIIFTLPFELSAGRYTVDTAVTDPEGNRASVKRISLFVPKPGQLSISSLEVVREIEHSNGPHDRTNPLEFAGGKVVPALNQTSRSGSGTALFFVLYVERSAPKPKVTVSFFKDGAEVARNEPEIGAPGQIQAIPVITIAKTFSRPVRRTRNGSAGAANRGRIHLAQRHRSHAVTVRRSLAQRE